jgi:hypothetical protein
MKSASVPPALRSHALFISDRVYRLLLAVYPAEFWRRYGPEMAQVFRTSCRASYLASGAGGVARLWLPTLWDWAWSAAGEWFSSLFRRSKMYNVHARRASSQLIPILFFLNACLILWFINPCSWLGGELYPGIETCRFEINNQSGKTLRVTPIYTDRNSFSPVRLYRKTLPDIPAYQQRNISVKSGELVTLFYDCSSTGVTDVSELYICDLEGECYVHQHLQPISLYVSESSGSTRLFGRFTINSLESLSRPDASLEAAVQSFPEHNYSAMKNVLLCFIMIIALIGGFYWLVRIKNIELPKHDI